MTPPKPVVLCILDGWGLSETTEANAPVLAQTPNFDRIMQTCANATLITHGPDVGLPRGQMGNSEVGHTNIGAGRVVAMDLGQIDLAIEDGSFFENDALQAFVSKLKKTGGTAHLMGLVSDGGVHGHLGHILAAAKAIAGAGVPVALHAITDGRDVLPRSARPFFQELQEGLPEGARVSTVTGRYFAMDRDNRWDRVQEAFEAMIHGQGLRAKDTHTAVTNAYARSESDEFVAATVIGDYDGAKDGDGFFCLNFRADRAREILSAVGDPADFMETVFPARDIVNTLGEWVAKHGKSQFHLAETEKYPHVTFFLNGGKEDPEPGEDRYMAASPRVATYDLQPEMSAPDVTEHFVGAIEGGYDLIVVNYANPDMVGHTGDLKAAMAACEAVDQGLGTVLKALENAGGAMIVTADHGNCETMIDPETGGPHTAHTLNPVPVILVGGPEGATLEAGRLADLAPTLLHLMGLPQPPEMTGECLIA
jgi:2,3-bisphosphoglycerate-independent phosphoglycerate mutase